MYVHKYKWYIICRAVILRRILRIEQWIKENTGYKPVISNVELGQSRKRKRYGSHAILLARISRAETTTTFKRHYLVGPNTRS